jgi:iron complex outermembrane receptor protein
MSELIQKHDNRATIRWKLLTGVSALALTAYVSSVGLAHAEDSDRSQVWIELGGQLSRLDDGQETFAPPLMTARSSIFTPPEKFERPPLFSIDETGSISFQPEDSDWILSGSIRYGRSASKRHVHQQTNPANFTKYLPTSAPTASGSYLLKLSVKPNAAKFADTRAQNSDQHLILDFQAGKDVGLGMFGGKDGSSVLSLGVRFAQFTTKSNIALKSNPDWHFYYKYFPSFASLVTSTKRAHGSAFHSNAASLRAMRSFHGVGPSLSWNASAPFAGNLQGGELTFDWGLKAALLFGRQRTRTHHQTTGRYHSPKDFQFGFSDEPRRPVTYQPTPVNRTRSRNVTVPNVGGSVGLSWNLQNFKMSFGYRVDMFFNAIDGGIDARKNENRGFMGPYASISIGIGD